MVASLMAVALPLLLPATCPRVGHRSTGLSMLAANNDDLQPNDDLYEIIGAPKTATNEELRKAYRRRARTLHPDVPGGDAKAFRRLVAAFETLMDQAKRAAWDTRRKRSSARERAQRQWEDGGRDRGAGRPAGSRWQAERRGADSREQSERRRKSWRKNAFESIWRENMPLDSVANEAQRAAFIQALEDVVLHYASTGTGGTRRTSATDAESSKYASSSNVEANELQAILAGANLEVLRVELQDATHREAKHRDRARWLEGELEMAERKAEMWRGAAPSTQSDRVQSLERELNFLELANRLRERLADQRLALQQLAVRKKSISQKLAAMRESNV